MARELSRPPRRRIAVSFNIVPASAVREPLKLITIPGRAIGLYVAILVLFIAFNGLLFFTPVDMRMGSILAQIVVILGGALVYRKYFSHPEVTWPSLRSLGMSPVALFLVLVTSVLLGLMSNALVALQLELFPALKEPAMEYQAIVEDLLLPDDVRAQVVGAVAVAVVAPVCEEILFRGTLLPEQRRGQLTAGAIIVNGLLFSLMHLSNPVGFLALAIVGAYFAHITVRSGALWGAILGHAALNLVNGVILLRVAHDLGLEGVDAVDEVAIAELLAATGLLVAASAFLWWLSIRWIQSPGSTNAGSSSSIHST